MVIYNIKNSKELASYINYTNLNNMITEGEMREFLEKAKEMNFNSVIISPTYVKLAKEILADTDIKVGSVVGFPLGFESTESKVAETKALIEIGADEIDVVMNLSHIKDEKYDLIESEISQIKNANPASLRTKSQLRSIQLLSSVIFNATVPFPDQFSLP